MLSAEYQKMRKLEEFVNPMTWRFNLATTWGITSQELTLDVPELFDKLPESIALGTRIWHDFIASAISSHCVLSFLELVRWKQSPLPILGATGAPGGGSHLAPSSRENSGVLLLHTQHEDDRARRRFYIPNMPAAWVSDRQLNDGGVSNLYKLAAIMFMALAAEVGGGPMTWLIAYPRVLPADPANLVGVGFRNVAEIRILSYCDRAPDRVPLDWP